jgi:hypothetical protein
MIAFLIELIVALLKAFLPALLKPATSVDSKPDVALQKTLLDEINKYWR